MVHVLANEGLPVQIHLESYERNRFHLEFASYRHLSTPALAPASAPPRPSGRNFSKQVWGCPPKFLILSDVFVCLCIATLSKLPAIPAQHETLGSIQYKIYFIVKDSGTYWSRLWLALKRLRSLNLYQWIWEWRNYSVTYRFCDQYNESWDFLSLILKASVMAHLAVVERVIKRWFDFVRKIFITNLCTQVPKKPQLSTYKDITPYFQASFIERNTT